MGAPPEVCPQIGALPFPWRRRVVALWFGNGLQNSKWYHACTIFNDWVNIIIVIQCRLWQDLTPKIKANNRACGIQRIWQQHPAFFQWLPLFAAKFPIRTKFSNTFRFLLYAAQFRCVDLLSSYWLPRSGASSPTSTHAMSHAGPRLTRFKCCLSTGQPPAMAPAHLDLYGSRHHGIQSPDYGFQTASYMMCSPDCIVCNCWYSVCACHEQG